MARNSNATLRDEKSNRRETESDNVNSIRNSPVNSSGESAPDSTFESHIIDASLKRRARLLITNSSIPRQTRALIRYALEIKDPYLAQVVRRVEAGEMTIDYLVIEQE